LEDSSSPAGSEISAAADGAEAPGAMAAVLPEEILAVLAAAEEILAAADRAVAGKTS